MTLTFSPFGREIRITPELRDHILVTLWIIVTFKQFRFDELILYPLALYFLWAFVRDFRQLFDIVLRSLILWAFPLWFLLSVTWGAETAQILKTGLQLVLTVMICYCAVLRLGPRQIVLSVLIAAGWFGVLSILKDPSGGVAARGVFSSKNTLGAAMVLLWMAALCIVLDPAFRRWIRLAAAAAIPLALRLIQISDSATAVLLAIASLFIVLALRSRSLLPLPALLTAVMFGCGAASVVGASIAASMPEFDPVRQVLNAFGKDTTLTGRTVLWNYAEQEIARHPLLGVGHGGFWTPQDGLSLARRIYDDFYKAYYATFSFHNSYYEIAVHQGLIGLGLAAAATFWILSRILFAALAVTSMPANFFVCIALVTLAQSLTEVIVMVQFELLYMLFIMGALLTLKRRDTAMAHFPDRPAARNLA